MQLSRIVKTTLLFAATGLCGCAKPATSLPNASTAAAPGATGTALAVDDGARGQALADALLARWKAENPGVSWEAEERKSRTFVAAADNKHLLAPASQAPGHPYRNPSERDLLEWKRETEKMVVAGSKVFHSATELGGTVGVSCDMCHPNAANTHAETYPKYQTQLGRVVLLRDMINWCLEQPVRAPPMAADDPRMRALEAYLISQRAGVKLEYGKH